MKNVRSLNELDSGQSGLESFVFHAEYGIRFRDVTGVQTCALPIWLACHNFHEVNSILPPGLGAVVDRAPIPPNGGYNYAIQDKIGRASCRERVYKTAEA